MQDELKVYESKMEKTLDVLLDEFGSIRAGRANPHVLDRIKVDYYGTPTPIQQVGNINVPEARMIVIQPWEKSLLKSIEKAILTSDLGINPTNDGSVIRLVFPELTEERRKDLAKDVKKKGEAAKVAVRNIRRDANESLKKMEKNGDISEDDLKDGNDKIQKLTDKMIAKVDKAVEEKTAEIMSDYIGLDVEILNQNDTTYSIVPNEHFISGMELYFNAMTEMGKFSGRLADTTFEEVQEKVFDFSFAESVE